MVVYNVICNMALEVKKKWLEWIDKQLNVLSKSEKKNVTSILKFNLTKPPERSEYALKYHILDYNAIKHFINNEDKIPKEKIRKTFEEAGLHFNSQPEIIIEFP